MAKVVVTGGNGLVGKRLCNRLQALGYEVAILSRSAKKYGNFHTYTWNLDAMEIEKEAIETADYIIHLAGANIGDKRWTPKRKRLIVDSRVDTGQLIFRELKKQNKKLSAFISASAIGYYGATTSDKIYTETDLPENDFLGNTCRLWEQMAVKIRSLGIRTVKIRIGVVLSEDGGALSKMKTPVNMGVGSPIGNGKQYMPWIHIDDLCAIFIKAIEDTQMNGPYNAVAPEHTTNKEFTRMLAKVLKKPFWFPNIPAFVIKLMFGKMAKIILEGSRVSVEKLKLAGFHFQFPTLEGALRNLLKEK